MPSLNSRRKMFCEHFVLDPNATRAALAAGYSPRTARQQGSRLLHDRQVSERIAAIRRDMARDHCIDPGTLMGKLEAVYRRAMEDHAFTTAARVVELQARLAGLDSRRRGAGDDPAEKPQRREMSAASRS